MNISRRYLRVCSRHATTLPRRKISFLRWTGSVYNQRLGSGTRKRKGETRTLWFRKHRSWDLGANVKHTDGSKSETKEKHSDYSKSETKQLDADNIARSGENPFAKLPPTARRLVCFVA